VVNTLPVVVIPDVNVLPAGTLPNTVYLGYAPASTITLVAGSATTNLQYAWSNGGAGASITVSPVAGTLYSVTVTDANGCRSSVQKFIQVVDVRCGNKGDKVSVCKSTHGNAANEICVSSNAVPAHLSGGAMLGSCTSALTRMSITQKEEKEVKQPFGLSASPNPATQEFQLQIQSGNQVDKAVLIVRDASGRRIEEIRVQPGQSLKIGSNYASGWYYVELLQGNERAVLKLIKL
jgi:hypothetical protein